MLAALLTAFGLAVLPSRAAGPIPLDLSLRLKAGEILALVGPLGPGKTTELRSIAGLWRPTAARVAVGGRVRFDTVAGPLWLPRIDGPAGAVVGPRILAHEVILSRARLGGLSALNVLAARVAAIIPGEEPGAVVRLALGRAQAGRANAGRKRAGRPRRSSPGSRGVRSRRWALPPASPAMLS